MSGFARQPLWVDPKTLRIVAINIWKAKKKQAKMTRSASLKDSRSRTFVDNWMLGMRGNRSQRLTHYHQCQLLNAIAVRRKRKGEEGRQERRAQRDRRQEARGEEFRNRLEQLINIAGFRSGGRYLPSARGGIKFTGMQDQGLAMLHRGEFVVPETGQMPQAVQRTMGMGQSGINITINAAVVESNAVDELVRQIERRFQTFGSSTSPLFGGR